MAAAINTAVKGFRGSGNSLGRNLSGPGAAVHDESPAAPRRHEALAASR